MRNNQLRGMSDKMSDIILVVMCTAVMLIVAYPLYYVLIASVSDPYDVYAGKTFLLPSQFTLKGYTSVFAGKRIFTGYMNSIKYTVVGTIFSVIMVYITAYPLSRKSLPGRKWISIFFIITMYFGGGLVPTYLVVKNTGLLNNTGFNRDFVHERKCVVANRGGEIKLRILLDRYSAEVFVNDGEQALTMTFYTPQTANGISFECSGQALISVKKYDIITAE